MSRFYNCCPQRRKSDYVQQRWRERFSSSLPDDNLSPIFLPSGKKRGESRCSANKRKRDHKRSSSLSLFQWVQKLGRFLVVVAVAVVNAAALAIAVVVAAAAVDLYIVRSSLNIARAYFHLVIDSLNYLTQSGVAHMMRRARSVPTFFPEIINTKKFLMQLVPLLIYGWKMAHKSDLFTFFGGNFHFLHISSFSRCSTKGRWILSYCTLYWCCR